MNNAVTFKNDVLAAATMGAVANFPWEMAHSLLYRSAASFTWKQHLICCGLASLADGIGIAAIYGIGAALFRESRWTYRRTSAHLCATALLGLVGAVTVEKLALRLDWWAYGPAMPRVPGTDLGISPLVQFILLPLGVLFWMLPRWWSRRKTSYTKLIEHQQYIRTYGEDMPEIRNWKWSNPNENPSTD